MAGSASLATTVTIYKKLPYDPTKDFAPLALITRIPFVLVVNPALPIKSVAELIQYAKDKPGHLSYASGGPGSPHHLYTELFKSMAAAEDGGGAAVPCLNALHSLDRAHRSALEGLAAERWQSGRSHRTRNAVFAVCSRTALS